MAIIYSHADELVFQPKYYRVSFPADQPQLAKDPDHLIGSNDVYIVKGEFLDNATAIDPVSTAKNTFHNPFQTIGRYLQIARHADQKDLLSLYDPQAVEYITKTILSNPVTAAKALKGISECEGFRVKAILQESPDLWLVVGYPISHGQTDKYLMPFLLKDKGGGEFILSAGPGNLTTQNLNIQGELMVKGIEGLSYKVVDAPH